MSTESYVQPAFGLGAAGPAAAARVLTRCHPAGARLAADRRVAVVLSAGSPARRCPRCSVSRSSCVHGAIGFSFTMSRFASYSTTGRVRAGRRLLAAYAGDPGGVAGQRLVERVDLPQRAALVRVAGEQVLRRTSRPARPTVCSGVTLTRLIVKRRRRPRPGCRSSRRSGSRCPGTPRPRPAPPGRQVGQRAVGHRRGHHQLVAEGLPRPLQDLVRRGVREVARSPASASVFRSGSSDLHPQSDELELEHPRAGPALPDSVTAPSGLSLGRRSSSPQYGQ